VAPSSSASPHPHSATLAGQFQYLVPSAVLGLRVWRDHAAWISSGDGKRIGDQVMVLDLATHTAKAVVTVSPTHVLDYVAGDADTVVYVELAGRPTDDSPMVNWAMKTVDLPTGDVATIASSTAPVHYALAPMPSFRSPWIAWAEPIPVPEGQRVDSTVVSYNVQTNHRLSLTDPGGSYGVAVVGSTVLYEQNQPTARASYDIYERPADGSRPSTKLTNLGYVKQPYGGAGWIGWQGLSGGYTSVWIMQYDPLSGHHGQPVDLDPRSEGNAHLGNGFIMWLAFGGPLQLQPLPAGTNDAVLNIAPESELNIAGNWDAWGNTIAWTGYDAHRKLVINVATVSVR